jgi:PiT family inorganic phosphate transporter
MTTLALVTLLLTIFFALIFNLANGWNDAANAVATVVATRVLTPTRAIIFGAVLNFVGALFVGEVAKTVGHDIAAPAYLNGAMFLAAVMTAPIWITWCSFRGLPNSCSHALLGALIGSVIAASGGVAGLEAKGIRMILFGVVVGPLAGFVLGYVIVRITAWVGKRMERRAANSFFAKIQLLSAGALAFAHGTGDGQKAMGIITGALLTAGVIDNFKVPLWVQIMCGLVMALGTALGGWRVMKTLGTRLMHIQNYQGFAAQTAASTTILLNTVWGIPLSTTHSITGAIMGVGAAKGIKAVRWGVGRKIIFAWIVTFPVCILGGALVYLGLRAIGIR